jgi:uncharacterized delta-60 repeat protein
MGAKRVAALLTTIFLLALAPAAQGAAGFPDPRFGSGGFTVLDDPAGPNEELSDLMVQSDGKILAVGRRGLGGALLARFNSDGTPDAGFGNGGISVLPFNEQEGDLRSIADLAPRSDGSFVAAGLGIGPGANAFGFARFLPSGSLDPAFGSGGLQVVPISPFGQAAAVDLAPDRKVVGAGEGKEVAVVVRLTEEGEPDPTFHTGDGIRTVAVPGSISEAARAVRVLDGGTVLIGGLAETGAFLAELDVNGDPVAGFGTAGIAVHDLGTDTSPSGTIEELEVLPDGRILAVGRSRADTEDTQLIVARFTAGGKFDTSFATEGIFRSNPTGGGDEGTTIEVLPGGRLLVAGRHGELGPNSGDTWLLRLTADGQLDPSFGSGGETVADVTSSTDSASALAVQPDGRAVIAGFAEETAIVGSKLLVGRFTADDPLPAEPNPPRCRGRAATLTGTPQADLLTGTPGPDVIVAFGGKDRISTGAGNDAVCAGAGKDFVRTGRGSDAVLGQAGPDSAFGGPGRDLLLGGPAVDALFGGPGPDRLVGGPGRRDFCNGGAGRERRARAGCERRKRIP